MIAGRMTMRAKIERDTSTGSDDWGGDTAPSFTPLTTAKCFAWTKSGREIADGTKGALIKVMRIMFPLGTDVQPDDEISDITDRRGAVLIPGRLKVDGPIEYKHNHLEATLERVS